MSTNPTFGTLADAIVREENSQYPNDVGGIMSNGQPVDFGSDSASYQALLDKLQYDASGNSTNYSPNMTLADFENVYTGGDPNAADNIASILGVPTSTTLGSLSDQSLGNVAGSLGASNAGNVAATGSQSNAGSSMSPSGNASSTPGGFFGALETWLTNSTVNIVAVLIGLVLIAGAVWGFDTVRETVVSTAKGAAELAA